MEAFFSELFEYNFHYNQKLIGLLLGHRSLLQEKAIPVMNHIINAHQVWNSRLLAQPSFGIFEIHAEAVLLELDDDNFRQTKEILTSIDLSRQVNYANSRGQTFSNSVRDVLFHVINHSTYHRGQIALECRRNAVEPLPSDYIFYKRNFQ